MGSEQSNKRKNFSGLNPSEILISELDVSPRLKQLCRETNINTLHELQEKIYKNGYRFKYFQDRDLQELWHIIPILIGEQEDIKFILTKAPKCKDILGERCFKALMLFAEGVTFQGIAHELGCSEVKAHQVVAVGHRLLRECWPDVPRELWTIVRPLREAGYDTKKKIIAGIKTGNIHPYGDKIKGYGKKSHKIVCDWLGIDGEKYYTRIPPGIKKAIALLVRNGYEVKKRS